MNTKTELYSGEKVSRSDLRIDALGDTDELGAVLGIARNYVEDANLQKNIYAIQELLFALSAECATSVYEVNNLERRIEKNDVDHIIENIAQLHEQVNLPNTFVIAGQTLSGAYLHHARTIARRVERRITVLAEQKFIVNEHVLEYINRLSFYLFLLSLYEDQKASTL